MLTRKVINFTALALFLSLAENFIPRPLPFLRLGLANVAILLALSDTGTKEYLILTVTKALASSYLSGTLLTPFLLISLSQSIASGLMMLFLSRLLKDRVSLYGLSMAGAAVSAAVQLGIASIFLGTGLISLLFILLIFSLLASLITAFIAYHIKFDSSKEIDARKEGISWHKAFTLTLFLIILLAMSLENTYSLLAAFILMIPVSLSMKRKFKVLNYVMLIIAALFSALIIPRGEVLIRIFSFPITALSLTEGLNAGLKLSLTVIISLSFSSYMFSGGSISLIMKRFFSMESAFYSTKGNLKEKINTALTASDSNNMKERENKTPYITSIIVLAVFITLKFIEIKVL